MASAALLLNTINVATVPPLVRRTAVPSDDEEPAPPVSSRRALTAAVIAAAATVPFSRPAFAEVDAPAESARLVRVAALISQYVPRSRVAAVEDDHARVEQRTPARATAIAGSGFVPAGTPRGRWVDDEPQLRGPVRLWGAVPLVVPSPPARGPWVEEESQERRVVRWTGAGAAGVAVPAGFVPPARRASAAETDAAEMGRRPPWSVAPPFVPSARRALVSDDGADLSSRRRAPITVQHVWARRAGVTGEDEARPAPVWRAVPLGAAVPKPPLFLRRQRLTPWVDDDAIPCRSALRCPDVSAGSTEEPTTPTAPRDEPRRDTRPRATRAPHVGTPSRRPTMPRIPHAPTSPRPPRK